MENKTKSTQTFQCQGNLATCFALGKLHNDTQIGTTFPTEENQRPKGLRTTAVTVLNTKSKQTKVISYCKVLVTVSVSFLLLTEFVSVLSVCEDNKDLPRTCHCSARLRRGQVPKQVKNTFQNGQFYIKLCSFCLTEYSFNIKFVSMIFVLAFWSSNISFTFRVVLSYFLNISFFNREAV